MTLFFHFSPWLWFVVLALMAPALMGCASGEEPRDAGVPVEEGYVDAGEGVQLFYRQVGESGEPVVVLHGGPGFSMEYFGEELNALAAGRTLIFYDQRGSGRSTLVETAEALDAQHFAEDLEAVRRHFGLEQVKLLGHSWGASVAALYASRYPDRIGKLLIVGGTPLYEGALTEAFEQLARNRDEDELERLQALREARLEDPENAEVCRALYEIWFRPFFAVDDPALRSQMDACSDSPEALVNKVRNVDRYVGPSLGAWDWRPAVRDVEAPALILHGTEDPLPPEGAREWAAVLPNARLLLLEGIGHFPYLEAPETFFAAADTFLRGQWPEEAQEVAEDQSGSRHE